MSFSRALVLDDHPMMAEAIIGTIKESLPQTQFALAHSLKDAQSKIRLTPFDLIIADLHMADAQGLETVNSLKSLAPNAVLAICSATSDKKQALDCLEQGASAFISKSDEPNEVLYAMQQLMAGRIYFSATLLGKSKPGLGQAQNAAKTITSNTIEPIVAGTVHPRAAPGVSPITERQAEVIGYLLKGLSNHSIAQTLGVSDATVKIHVAAALRHFGVTNRVQLLVLLSQ